MNSDSQLLHHLNSTRHKVIYKIHFCKLLSKGCSKYFQRTLEDFQAGIIPYSQQAGVTVPVVTGTSKRNSESSLDSQSSE